ncbi:MAG: restriction endonuclease subunit S [Oscillospiraceae bacterium]
MNWKHVSLGEISVNIQTGPFGSQLHQSDYSEKGTPVVMPKDLISGHISEESIARVSDDHVERLSRHKIEVGDILYSRRGDVGRCAFASETEAGWLCGTGCLRVTIDSRKANPKFVFYQLLKADTIGWVEKHAVGSTMLNLNTSILSSVPIDLPSHDKQNHIVGVLSAYDDLIENNQKQIKLLEEAAQRLYKEWFVDLRFPGHETTPIVDGVPDGWTYKPFSEVFDYVRGKSYTSKELSDTTGILKKKNLIMKDLQELIRVRLDAMLFNNPDRIKYHERYQEIIEDYNSQQDRANIEKTFDELMDLVQNMDQEERRYVREGFSSDEELSLYDMLFSENLSKQDIQKIKKVAVDLLQKVKSKIAELDHWTDKQETKATIDTLIRDTLWLELPECYDELRISEYRQRIYEYVYTRYKGVA